MLDLPSVSALKLSFAVAAFIVLERHVDPDDQPPSTPFPLTFFVPTEPFEISSALLRGCEPSWRFSPDQLFQSRSGDVVADHLSRFAPSVARQKRLEREPSFSFVFGRLRSSLGGWVRALLCRHRHCFLYFRVRTRRM